MDINTRQELERISALVPRYLFRVWNIASDGVHRVSGGFVGLNQLHAIIPLGLASSRGNHSVFDLTKEQFTEMVIKHVTCVKEPSFRTGFSSWAASLAFALHFFGTQLGAESTLGHGYVGVSVIDTNTLRHKGQIFYVPHLAFLDPRFATMNHEHVVYGRIDRDPAHRAVPFSVFRTAGFHCNVLLTPRHRFPMLPGDHDPVYCLTVQSMKGARQIGDQYGPPLDLAVCLAYLCRVKRDAQLYKGGISVVELHTVLEGIRGLQIPCEWSYEMQARIARLRVWGFGDVEQFWRLMEIVSESYWSQMRPVRPLRQIQDIPDEEAAQDSQIVISTSAPWR